MSNQQVQSNATPLQSEDEMVVRWVDLSPYKIYIGVHQVTGSPKRLLLIDETNRNEWLAKAMQMTPSKIPGIWFRMAEGESFYLPPECKERFPKIRALKIPVSIRDRILKDRLSRMRVAHESARPEVRPGWRPVTEVREPVKQDVQISSAAKEIDKITYCGINHLGQLVMEDGNGCRFTKVDNKIAAWESDVSSADFLRVSDDQDVLLCARGLVQEMQTTKMRSPDFERYLRAIFGESGMDDKDKIESLQGAVDEAMIEVVNKEVAASGPESAFVTAVSLQQMRPSYFRKNGALPTPPALSLLMQNILGAKISRDQFADPRVISATTGRDNHAWLLDAKPVDGLQGMEAHDYFVGGIYANPVDEVVVDGLSVTRQDHLHIIKSLQQRSEYGTSVFVTIADEKPGEKVDIATRALLEWVGSRYSITGLVNLDAGLIAEGVEKGSRLLIVGEKKAEMDLAFVPPQKIPFVFGYEELWSWAASVAENGFQEVDRFGDLRQPNLLQVPYIPASKASEPISMAPRNLMAPMRVALSNLSKKVGATVDEYVMEKMGLSQAQLEDSSFLCSEQIDAIAMGISAIDEDRAFILADQAGLGKGRVLAALAAYAVRNDKKVMFITEKPDLYGDFYRDARNIGVDKDLDKPFIFNTSGSVREMDGVTVMYEASDPDTVLQVCQSRQFPQDHKFALATFSMFNQDPATEIDMKTAEEVRVACDAILAGTAFDDVPEIYQLLGINNGVYREKVGSAADRMACLNQIASYSYSGDGHRTHPEDHVSMARHEIEFRGMPPRKLAREIEKRAKLPLNAWRGYWGMSSEALRDVVLLIDESHNAAGMSSNTGGVIRQMTRNAGAVVFSSATFSKDEKNIPLYSRALPSHIDPGEVSSIIVNGGEPMREIFTAMLAEDGVMIRREHDTSGINFKPVVDESRVAGNIKKKDAIASIMANMARLASEIQKMVTQHNDSTKGVEDTKRFTMSYSGPFSRFYAMSRILSASLNADFTADLAIEAIKNGKKPVITTENTMESIIKEMAANQDRVENASFKDVLLRYIDRMFTVYSVQRAGRRIVSRRVVTDHLTPEFQNEIKRIKQDIQNLPNGIPISPIDAVRQKIEAAGYSFDEITGRKIRLSTGEDGKQFIEPIADIKEGAAKRILSRFNNGTLDVICLSNSGSTGISAHADKNFEDVRQRVLIELQPASDIRKRIQIYGRVFRNGQVQPPEYIIPSTGMHHERRLTMIQNNSSRKMSSSVSGNADNSMINHDVPEIMNPVGDEVCRTWLETRPDIAALMNIKVKEGDDDEDVVVVEGNKENISCGTDFVDRLTGRLFMLPSDEEAAAWAQIYAEFESRMEQIKASGYNPLESSRRDMRAKQLKSVVVNETPVSAGYESVFAKPVVASEIEYQVTLPALDPAVVAAEIDKNKALFERSDFGTKDGLSKKLTTIISDELKKMANEHGYGSLNIALASENNPVRNKYAKLNRMTSAIDVLAEAGAVVYVESLGACISLGVTPPQKDSDYLRPSMWKVRLLDVASHQIVDRRISSIKEAYKRFSQDVKPLLSEVSQSQIVREKRIVLGGNLFEASILSANLKAGEAVSYSLSNGTWRHGFLMPEEFRLNDIMEMHLPVVDAEETYAVMTEKAEAWHGALRDMVLTNSFKSSHAFIKISRADSGDLEIESPRPEAQSLRPKRSAITRDSELKALIEDGEFTGSKGVLKAVVPSRNAIQAIARIADICKRVDEPLLIHSSFREKVNAYRVREREALANADSAKDVLLSSLGIS